MDHDYDSGVNNSDGDEAMGTDGSAGVVVGKDAITTRLINLGFISPSQAVPTSVEVCSNASQADEGEDYQHSVLSDDGQDSLRPNKRARCADDPKILPYAGEPKQDLVYWLMNYQQMASSRGWDEKRMKANLASYLTGDATIWCYNRREAMGSDEPSADRADLSWSVLTWDQVKEELKDAFLPADYEVLLRERLGQSQGNQDVVSFFHRKMHICRQLRCSPTETIRAIRKALRPEYRRYLGSREITRPTELLRDLKNADLSITDDRRASASNEELVRQYERLRQENVALKRQARMGQASAGESTSPGRGSGRKVSGQGRYSTDPKGCFSCGGTGHFKRECPKRKK
jgi:hypothetical protein